MNRIDLNVTIKWLLIMIFAIWTLPRPLSLPNSGLDPSWNIGINKAASDNMQFGTDIVFPFGPLGFLYVPTYLDHNLWLISLTFTLFIHFLFLFSIALLMTRSSINWKEYITILAIVYIPIHFIPDDELVLSTVILLYLIVTREIDQKYDIYVLSLISIFLAIASLTKFNIAIASLSIIIMFSLICIFKKELRKFKKKCLYMSILYIVSISVLWIVSGQNLINLTTYLFNSYELSYGYNDAMTINGPEWQIYIGTIGIIFILILALYSLIKKIDKMSIFIMLNSGPLFLAFKHGFVRHDGHVYIFFTLYTIFFVCLYIISKDHINFSLRFPLLLLSIVFVAVIYNGFPNIMKDNILQKLPDYEKSLSLISNQSYQNQVLEDSKIRLRRNYPLDDNDIDYLNNKTVDIFPWDIALIWAYNFNWSPRPIFQSYAAYTQHLDKLNEQHFSPKNAPQAILYSYRSIDGRYPLFDEPSTFASILFNYTVVNKSEKFLLLSYNSKENFSMIQEDLGTVKAEFGQPIEIPKYDGYVFAYIDIQYSTFGKFKKLFYKPSLSYVIFKLSDSTYSKKFRFIPSIVNNGVLISRYVEDTEDLASVFSSNIRQDITEMTIYVDNYQDYNMYIYVKFVGIPVNIRKNY